MLSECETKADCGLREKSVKLIDTFQRRFFFGGSTAGHANVLAKLNKMSFVQIRLLTWFPFQIGNYEDSYVELNHIDVLQTACG